MRLKLILLVSLIASVVGAGSSTLIILSRSASLHVFSSPDLVVISTFVLPVACIILAGFFVYRHTSRRRKTQALLTGLLAAFLSLGVFIAVSILTSRTTPIQPQPVTPRNVS